MFLCDPFEDTSIGFSSFVNILIHSLTTNQRNDFSIFSAVSRQIKFYLIIKIEVGVMIIVSLVPGTFKGCAEPVQGRAKPICVQ